LFFFQVSIAQTFTCPENTFLGVYDCSNITDVPYPVNTLEDAMAPPYNIQIEGGISPALRVITEDNNLIFFCDGDSRLITRKLVFYLDANFNPLPFQEPIAECSFTIETIPYLTLPEFTVPPNIELACGIDPSPENAGNVTGINLDCPNISDGVEITYSDVETVNVNITSIQRTWTATNICGTKVEKQQFITINCVPQSGYTITCPENTLLGVIGCADDVPQPVNNIEEAIAPPYNIQIEGEIPATLRVITEDDNVIFFCNEDQRIVTRKIIFYIDDLNEPPWYGGVDAVAECTFTIETIADVGIPQFTVPPDIEILCNDDRNPENTGDVDDLAVNCQAQNDGLTLFFSDTETIQGDFTIINRTWIATNACGNTSEQVQTITISCETECVPPNAGTFDCDN